MGGSTLTTKALILMALAGFLLGTAAAQEEGSGDPGIVFTEPVAWNDPEPWGGNPPPWFEDPATVDCGAHDACWASLENKTA